MDNAIIALLIPIMMKTLENVYLALKTLYLNKILGNAFAQQLILTTTESGVLLALLKNSGILP